MIEGVGCRLRAYRIADAERLAEIAGDFLVARWMTARFPHPYTIEAARAWVALAAQQTPITDFAIDVDGCLAGGVGFAERAGEERGVAEFGYWLGRAYWGRGIATEAAKLAAAHAFAAHEFRRLEAHVFAANVASARVLEKAGFVREALLPDLYLERDGTVADGILYARLRAARQTTSGSSWSDRK